VNPELVALATGHRESRWAADLAANTEALRASFTGRRVLIIGGAGSIGASTVRALVPFAPASLHVIDHDENDLAELVRDIRGRYRVTRGATS
jgi:FlaA1/EpsC-like NDP-sugar epimerase